MGSFMKTAPISLRERAEGGQAPGLSWEWTAFGAIVLASCGHLLIKVGLVAAVRGVAYPGMLPKILHYLLEPEVAAGLAIYAAGTALWISAVSRRNISFLYPLTALNYVLVGMGGRLFLGEHISTGRWLGIAVVVAGVALMQLSVMGEKS